MPLTVALSFGCRRKIAARAFSSGMNGSLCEDNRNSSWKTVNTTVNMSEVLANDIPITPFIWSANTQLVRIDNFVVLDEMNENEMFRVKFIK